ncbi:MAG: hypothetical protein JW720_00185 [Sedimentisphaerales bacterium]|nr:hypothetical protein [Sedimentisphaerales bacterium]
MTANINTRTIESSGAKEIFVSAAPQHNTTPAQAAEQIFSGISDILTSANARILQERVFATGQVMDILTKARSQAYAAANLDDGVPPSLLVEAEGLAGPVAGVQVHAISGDMEIELVELDQSPKGRLLKTPNHKLITLSGLSVPQLSCANEQARICLEKAEAALLDAGTDFLSVARTWMWLKNILSWYDDFNGVRNKFFTERGIIGNGTRQLMPASTGIGLGAADQSHCAMDVFAVLEPAGAIQLLEAGGKQQSAFEYGSAFSRASRTPTPAGETVFVSGTASIDASGATTHIGDPEKQIKATIENVRAVLRDMNVADDDVVHIIAYCKTTEVEKVFDSIKGDYDWPWIVPICDVCRDDLLFEIEATAAVAKDA